MLQSSSSSSSSSSVIIIPHIFAGEILIGNIIINQHLSAVSTSISHMFMVKFPTKMTLNKAFPSHGRQPKSSTWNQLWDFPAPLLFLRASVRYLGRPAATPPATGKVARVVIFYTGHCNELLNYVLILLRKCILVLCVWPSMEVNLLSIYFLADQLLTRLY